MEAVAGAAVAVDKHHEPIRDRVGIGWRGKLAAGIFSNIEQIDILEVIADDHYRAPSTMLRALRTLAAHVPITLHGVGMGLASTEPAQVDRMEKMARLVDALQPDSWSEHLAFVRAGCIEIGHLAAPPRTAHNVEAAIANIERAKNLVGSYPLLENIATLINPPASSLDEGTWVSEIISGSGTGLLLDLHNLYANALNFGEAPKDVLRRFPLDKVSVVHLSGGHWIPEPGNSPRMRLLDDHVHDVPAPVYSLLTTLAQHARQPLTVILERDGNYPAFDSLLNQISAARDALRLGRSTAHLLSDAA